MKRLWSVILCLCLILAGLALLPGAYAAADSQPDMILEIGDYQISINGSNAQIRQYQGDYDVVNLTLPDSFYDENFGVTYTTVGIMANAFYGRAPYMETVTIPGSVNTIADDAFAECPKLATVRYNGTRDKWEAAVSGHTGWDGGSGAKVYCKQTFTVSFRVEYGAWDDGTAEEKQVTLGGYEDEELKLPGDKIPAAGSKPDEEYRAGAWDTAPKADALIEKDTVFVYSYAKITYGEPEWAWSEDFSSAKAAFKATTGDDTQTIDAKVTSETTAATCTEDGKTVYTAAVTFKGKDYQDKKTAVIPRTGHSYGEPEWKWADDFSSASAAFQCKAGDDSTSVEAKITAETTAASCTEDGKTVYTAAVTFNGKEYKDEKTAVIQKTGHQPGDPVRENEIAPGCETDGRYEEAVYCETCTAEISRTEYTIKALGHEWGAEKVTKKASHKAEGQIVQVCQRDPSHKKTTSIPTRKTKYSVKKKSFTFKASKVKKKSQTVRVNFSVTDKAGSVKYKFTVPQKAKKYIKVNQKNKKITVKKGTPKGTYKVKLTITSAATTKYKSYKKTFTIKIVVK